MSEEQNVNNGPAAGEEQRAGGATRTATEASWDEVGKQFKALGESIAQAMRTAWENEDTQRQVSQMRTGLESMVKDVEKAIQDAGNTPEGQRLRQDAGKAAQTLKTAGQQTVEEVRPQLVRALEQLNDELQKLINRMEKKEQAPKEPEQKDL